MKPQRDLDRSPRMLGWHHSWEDCQQSLDRGEMLHLLAETTNRCNFDCEYCYTVLDTISPDRPFHMKALPGELVREERLHLIDSAVDLGAKSYDIVGAGEPLLDPLLLEQVMYAVSCGLQPIIFTNGSVLSAPRKGRRLAEQLWELGATIVVKHHGSADIHDRIVGRSGASVQRDRALHLLMELGFHRSTPTRLGIDNIIYQATLSEIPDCLRWCRKNNVYLVCSSFIPSGRTQKATEQAATWTELEHVFVECRRIDAEEFGIQHSGRMPFIGSGRACTQYLGLYTTIQGDVHGCVGKMETYGNVRSRPLSEMWRERLPLLRASYTGGCPPREKFYEANGVSTNQRLKLF